MAPSFDLVSEPWIPCVRLDGSPDEVGLLDALIQAHEIREVVDASPLVTASLHRLLLAILHRNFGPRNFDAWRELWETGRFNEEVLTEYFDDWRHRFDLFDDERPFYQTAGMPEKMLKPVMNLSHEKAQGNNPTLFDHSNEREPESLTPAQASRAVVTHQASALHGLVSRERSAWGSAKAGPTARGLLVMPAGDSLFTLLMLNAPPESQLPLDRDDKDLPAWEQEEACWVEERAPLGYIDYLTWQSRRLWLEPKTVDESVIVRRAISAKGCEFLEGTQPDDPMMAYVAPRGKSKEPFALELDEDRALWRDSMVLLSSEQDQWQRPRMVEFTAELVDDPLPRTASLDLQVIGMALQGRQRRNIGFWRHEHLPLPLRYLSDDDLVDSLRHCLELTEEVHKSVYGATRELAEEALTAGVRDADDGAVSNMIDSLGVSGHYWSSLELPFRGLIVDLAAEATDRFEHEGQWARLLRQTAWEAFERVERGLSSDARSLRAISHARRVLGGSLRKKLADYEEVTATYAD